MADIQFKRVRKIKQKDKDIIYGFMKEIQASFPDDGPYYAISPLIQDLCLLYFYTVPIDSTILTDEEKTKLLEMIENHRNMFQYDWKLLFRGSRDGFTIENFYNKCDLKTNTLRIIHAPQNHVFGGFTEKEWNKSIRQNAHHNDKAASNQRNVAEIFPVQNDGLNSIQHYHWGYLSFGKCGSAFFCSDRFDKVAIFTTCTFGYVSDSKEYKLEAKRFNGERTRNVIATDIEVFQIQ